MNVESLIMLLVGIGTVVGAVAIIIFRKKVAEIQKANAQAKFDKTFPGLAGRISTPAKMALAGVCGVAVGLLVIVKALSG